MGACYIMKPKEGKKRLCHHVHDEAKKKEEEKDCVIIFRLSELSLIP
jgi:hypothetical protein